MRGNALRGIRLAGDSAGPAPIPPRLPGELACSEGGPPPYTLDVIVADRKPILYGPNGEPIRRLIGF